MILEADRFLEDLTGRYALPYTEAVREMVVAMARGNRPALSDARTRMEEVITATMGAAEVLGATLMLRSAAKVYPEERALLRADREAMEAFREEQRILPRVKLQEAIDDMIDRTPRTIRRAAERTGQRIAQLYGEGRVVAFARSAESAVTERVQKLIVEAMNEGIPEASTGRLIKMAVDDIREKTDAWSEGYARMAFRTNLNTAVTAGRFRQAQDPDIKAVIPCFRFDAVGDGDTRDNHRAADGLIFKVDNVVWNRLAPPLGYNCRCRASLVSLPQLRRMGRVNDQGDIREDRVPSGSFADPGFRHGGRPDLFL